MLMPSNTPADQEVTRRYFELSFSIEAAKRHGDYKAAITAARETFPLLGRFVAAAVRDYGRWDIGFSHAVHTASSLMAVEEDRAAIADLRNTLRVIPKLSDWLPVADQADEDLAIIGHVKAAIRAEPGIRQAELRDAIGLPDGKRLSVLVGYLERGGHIRRVRTGKTYELYAVDSPVPRPTPDAPTGTASAPAPPASSLPPTTVTSPALWQGRSPRQPRELDLGRLRVIRLPVAPPAWDQAHKSRLDTPPAAKKAREDPAFTVTGDGWSVAEERKFAPEERPDPAFKQSYAGRRWIYWLDSRGRTTRWPEAPSILQVTDATGAVIAERGLGWDTYRIDTNVDGSAILFLSRDGVLHGYYHDLQPLLVARVRDLPEYRACAARLGIPDEHLKNHVRCVATSTDQTRYIVTVVDEAWCLSTTGEVLWGLRFPTSERWAPVSRSVEQAGSSSKVLQALTLIGLTLPVTPEDMTHAYRRRALEWHPDRNPGDPSAVRRMQELNAAMALLAGTDVSALTVPQIERVERYEDLTSRQTMGSRTLGISLTMSMTVGPLTAADWIYAVNFGESGRVYLAGYSGRVVEVNPEGNPVRVYDIGAVPRHVAETTQYLYLLTDTRLYIVKGTQLVALLDMFEQGRLIVSDTGLGLLEEKAFTWLSPTGQLIGAVRSRDPIRRVLRTTEGLVVESRQRRALVHGTPP
jgi:DnaJ-like protein